MRIIIASIVAALLITGCEKAKTPAITGDDGKPVAPTTYTDGKADKADPQLPPMIPHWKETK